jgi:hypothetical protein
MLKKIFSIILIIIGALLILAELLIQLTSNGPGSNDTAFIAGYYFAVSLFIMVGALLILWGVRIQKNSKKIKTEKDLLDSLPD